VVVGCGIVGAAVAAELSAVEGVAVTVVERGPEDRLLGSTGHAPGLVGLLWEEPVPTELARGSAAVYDELEHSGRVGFDRVGCLEVAAGGAAMLELERRAALAAEHGLPAQALDAAQAKDRAPRLVDAEPTTAFTPATWSCHAESGGPQSPPWPDGSSS
jgi:glycine/D-amino acid oxidase-like deaminating enzyme